MRVIVVNSGSSSIKYKVFALENRTALVVTIPAGGGEGTSIGAGRYIMYDPPNDLRSAEIAFTVEEDYHG